MAATTTSAVVSTIKIPKTHTINTHFFTHLTTIIPITKKPFKTLKLKPQNHHIPLSLLRASSFPESDTDPFLDTVNDQMGLQENFNESNENGDYNDYDNDGDDENKSELGRLYVGNLPYVMASAQLSEFFVEAGRVVSVEIVYDRVTDRSRGFAFVTMGSMKEAREAIRMFDGSQIGGRTVKVNFPEVPRGGEREVMGPKIRSSNQSFVDSPHKIYAGNLGWALTSQGLRDAFFDQPGLLSAKVVYDRATGRSRGFGFITFSSAEAMESALNTMNGVELEGRPLRLNKAEQRAPSTPLPQGGQESNFQSGEVLSSF